MIENMFSKLSRLAPLTSVCPYPLTGHRVWLSSLASVVSCPKAGSRPAIKAKHMCRTSWYFAAARALAGGRMSAVGLMREREGSRQWLKGKASGIGIQSLAGERVSPPPDPTHQFRPYLRSAPGRGFEYYSNDWSSHGKGGKGKRRPETKMRPSNAVLTS